MITNMLIYLLDTIFPTYNNLANECISAFIGPLLDHRQMKETRVLSNEFFFLNTVYLVTYLLSWTLKHFEKAHLFFLICLLH